MSCRYILGKRWISLLAISLISTATLAGSPQAPVSEPAVSNDIEKRLNKLENILQSRGLLDMLQQQEALQVELNQLRGEIETTNHEIEQLQNRQRDLYTDIDRRIQNIESNATAQTPEVQTTGDLVTEIPIAGTQPSEPAATQPTKTDTEQPSNQSTVENQQPEEPNIDPTQIKSEYERAFKLLKESHYSQAIKAFKKFLKTYPESNYSGNAQYWVAEAHYVEQNYKKAIAEYSNLVNNYPQSKKIPDSLLKIAQSYQELGQKDQAKLWYNDIRKRYPDTTAARLAEEKLKNLAN